MHLFTEAIKRLKAEKEKIRMLVLSPQTSTTHVTLFVFMYDLMLSTSETVICSAAQRPGQTFFDLDLLYAFSFPVGKFHTASDRVIQVYSSMGTYGWFTPNPGLIANVVLPITVFLSISSFSAPSNVLSPYGTRRCCTRITLAEGPDILENSLRQPFV